MKWNILSKVKTKMKILETTIDGLTKVDIVNSVVQLVIDARLYTEKLDPSKFDAPAWKDGRAEFLMHTGKGDILVSTTALEWQATRVTQSSFVGKAFETVSAGASYVRNLLGCSTCGN